MIEVKVLASGSKGNCTAVNCGKVTILLDAGIGFDRLQRALNFENPAAALITHEHQDHANKNTVAELLKRGVEVYMTRGTVEALKLEPRHNLKIITVGTDFLIDNLEVSAYAAEHDAAEPVNFYIVNGSLDVMAYVTDTNEIPLFAHSWAITHLIIEANHDTEALLAADIDERQKRRILQNHLSVEKVAKYIAESGREFLQEVHLIHISKRHGNAEKFKQVIQNIVGGRAEVFAY